MDMGWTVAAVLWALGGVVMIAALGESNGKSLSVLALTIGGLLWPLIIGLAILCELADRRRG